MLKHWQSVHRNRLTRSVQYPSGHEGPGVPVRTWQSDRHFNDMAMRLFQRGKR